MKVIPVMLIALLLIIPAGLVYGMNTPDMILSPHIKMIGLGDIPFSNVESFNLGNNHFKIYKQSGITTGYSSYNLDSPLGDRIMVNYSVTIHRSPFTVDFLQPNGYTPMYFSGQKTVQGSLYFSGYSSFKYMTLVYVIDNFRGAGVNGINISGVNDMSGYPMYNVSFSLSNQSYHIYIPGFLKVNGNVVTIFLRSFKQLNNLILEISFSIKDGYFQTLFYSVISSSYGNYADEYMSLLNEQGQYFSIYPTIMENYYSIIIGIIIFAAIFFMIYAIYRKK
ncbi:MAG: hypothetical protein ACP5LC_02875 [Thermoplasmata archaeon]